ncbi:hypothetical protein D8M04_15480 [Oceanobacillus piezotolerans]|uniref:Uncharacterized protein n=1 Tax=Oceanobacillus piezotolerans TaxID=2448030 RepID=A0A498DAJ0_9BACI|nr:hypothetical protein [Oceanobacillus piezotolerans]RLL41988.1 hypothetical protein D8M04_15480 [Oceanobacillus piezotolerans]
MELIERYIYAVIQKLPQSQREEISIELRGLIQDMLEERVEGRKPTDRDVEEVLQELGNPKNLAGQYRESKNYLIGPELYDSFILVLKVVMITLSIVLAIEFVVQIIIEPMSILEHFIDLIVTVVTVIPTAFGWTAIWFALAEHFSEINPKDLKMEKEWKPSDLPPIPDTKGQIKRTDPIAGIIFYVFLIALFSFSTNYFGVWIFRDGYRGAIPFLNPEANNIFLLFIILILGFGIIKESLKLVYRKWNVQLVVFTAILNVVSFLVVMLMISEPEFWNPTFMNELVQYGVLSEGTEAYQTVHTIWNQSTRWILVFMAIGLIWEIVDGLVKVFRQKK